MGRICHFLFIQKGCQRLSGHPRLPRVPLYPSTFVSPPAAATATATAGFVLFSYRIPERWWPGAFDLVGSSHQLWHVLVWAAGELRGSARGRWWFDQVLGRSMPVMTRGGGSTAHAVLSLRSILHRRGVAGWDAATL